jgi:anti-sigma-K factor RskA
MKGWRLLIVATSAAAALAIGLGAQADVGAERPFLQALLD